MSLLMAFGCTDSTEPATSTALGMEVASTAIQLAAGEERWLCWSFPVKTPFQMTATEISASSPLIHHYQLFKVGTDPAASGTDCGGGVALRDAVWLSVGGADTPGLRYPEGTAMEISGFLMLQLHILNASDQTISVPPFKMALAGSDAEELQRVGVLVVAPRELSIPPGVIGHKVSGACNPPEDVENVVAIYPHMHMLGQQIRVGVVPGGGSSTDLVNVPWDFDKQQIYSVTGTARRTDSLEVDCTYNNPSGSTVVFGESTTDEMCAGIIYHYPAEADFAFCGGR